MYKIVARLRGEKRAVRFLASRLLWRTGLCRLLTIRLRGYIIRFNPTSGSAKLWVYPETASPEHAFLEAYLRPNDVYIDIGANIGELTLTAAKIVGPQGTVYAAEAHPRIFGFLVGNLRMNKAHNVTTHNVALGDRTGSLTFSDKRSDEQNCVLAEGKGLTVSVVTLDSLTVGLSQIDLLKIDVEGYEPYVLQGANDTLRRTECVYLEACPQYLDYFGRSLGDLLAPLREAGLQTYRALEDGSITPVDAGYSPTECDNLVSVRSTLKFLSRTGYLLRESN